MSKLKPEVDGVYMIQLRSSEPLKGIVDYIGSDKIVYTLFDLDKPNVLANKDCVASVDHLKFHALPTEQDMLINEAYDIAINNLGIIEGTELDAVTNLIKAGYRKTTLFTYDVRKQGDFDLYIDSYFIQFSYTAIRDAVYNKLME